MSVIERYDVGAAAAATSRPDTPRTANGVVAALAHVPRRGRRACGCGCAEGGRAASSPRAGPRRRVVAASAAARGGPGCPASVAMMVLGRAYQRRCLGCGAGEYRRVLGGAACSLALMALVALLSPAPALRDLVAVTVPLPFVFTLGARFALRQWVHRARRRGRLTQRVLVVGSAGAPRELAHTMHRRARPGSVSRVRACRPRHGLSMPRVARCPSWPRPDGSLRPCSAAPKRSPSPTATPRRRDRCDGSRGSSKVGGIDIPVAPT